MYSSMVEMCHQGMTGRLFRERGFAKLATAIARIKEVEIRFETESQQRLSNASAQDTVRHDLVTKLEAAERDKEATEKDNDVDLTSPQAQI